MMNRIHLHGQVAVVTGGVQGIGLACVERILDSGARVAVWDRDESLLGARTDSGIAKSGHIEVPVVVDVTDPDAVSAALAETEQALGPVSVLVHSAGIAGPNYPAHEYPVADWRQIVDIDLNGTFYVNRAVIPGMIERNYGRIVNIASVAGKEGNPGASAYSAAKAGVIALTKSIGKELASYDIAVNCVTPAASRTRIFEQMSQQHIDSVLAKIPRGRFVEVTEIAALVAWLVSPENSFTTGAAFDLSGGRATY